MRFLGIFLIAWLTILMVMWGAAFVWAVLATIYDSWGLRGLAITLEILAAFAALFIALRFRNSLGAELVSFLAAKPRKERWFVIAVFVGFTAITLGVMWRQMTDPAGVFRPCVFCSPYEPYKSPPRTAPDLPPLPTREN